MWDKCYAAFLIFHSYILRKSFLFTEVIFIYGSVMQKSSYYFHTRKSTSGSVYVKRKSTSERQVKFYGNQFFFRSTEVDFRKCMCETEVDFWKCMIKSKVDFRWNEIFLVLQKWTSGLLSEFFARKSSSEE